MGARVRVIVRAAACAAVAGAAHAAYNARIVRTPREGPARCREAVSILLPLRDEADRKAVVEGLRDGTIDVISSAHCPRDPESKRVPFGQAAFGAVGLETLLPLTLELFHNGSAPLLDMLAKLTINPARLLGLDSGRLAAGAPADLIVTHRGLGYAIDPKLL